MTNKDEGVEDILKLNVPSDHKVTYLAELCRHRGKCMDQDAIRTHEQEQTIKRHEQTIWQATEIIEQLDAIKTHRSICGMFTTWLNTWAKS